MVIISLNISMKNISDSTDYVSRLKALRESFNVHGIDAFVLPVNDPWMSETPPAAFERLKYMTGFPGTAGFLVVTKDTATILVDGRYTEEVLKTTDPSLFTYGNYTEINPFLFASQHVKDDSVIGFDPHLFSGKSILDAQKLLNGQHVSLRALASNPIDSIWKDRPAPPKSNIWQYPLKYAGRSFEEKRQALVKELKKVKASHTLITAPDSLCWLLNVRASDLTETPVFLGCALVDQQGHVTVFCNENPLDFNSDTAFAGKVHFKHFSELDVEMALVETLLVDPKTATHGQISSLPPTAKIIVGQDPCVLPKACKNDTEQKAIREAHEIDAVAMISFMRWLEEQDDSTTELDAGRRLMEIRKEDPNYLCDSFSMIVGYGANGANIHGRMTENSLTPLEEGNLLLIDSGAQYMQGTTDITRVFPIGEPTPDMKAAYTAVLKAHIACSSQLFPEGTSGTHLDAITRAPLWDLRYDFPHGTGHGVGQTLNVHEPPLNISKKSMDALLPGLLVSIEPGFYKTGAFGVRLENLAIVQVEKDGWLHFEPVTLVPFERTCIDIDKLTPDEVRWVDDYHHIVNERISPRLPKELKPYLDAKTCKLG